MKLNKESACGRVLVCGPSIHKAIPDSDPFEHPSCMGVLNDHYVFAAFKGNTLPEPGKGLIAEMSLPVADTVCSFFLGKTFVFVTPKIGGEPKQSIMLRLEDWKSILSGHPQGACKTPDKYVRALLINVEDKPVFITAAVKKDFISKWSPTLFNVGAWLEEVWLRTGHGISDEELKLRDHENDDPAVRHTANNLGLDHSQKVRLLICHYFRYWENPAISYEGRGEILASLFAEKLSVNKESIHAAHVDATCVNLPLSTARRKFVSLCKEARMLRVAKPNRLIPTRYSWLLSVLFPKEFSECIEKGLSVAELTKSHVKQAILSEDILRLTKIGF